MIEDLKGKSVLITGASTGIGAAVARAFAAQGAKVGIHYNHSKSEAETLAADVRAKGGEATLLQGDLCDSGAAQKIVDAMVAEFGRLDVLINNAGSMVQRCPVAECTDELLDQVFDVNVRSVVSCCRAALAQFRKQGAGCIINTTSVAARNGGGPGAVLYASSKGFVSTFTRGLARESTKDNVRVNAVAPGVILTPFHERYSTPAQLEAMRATVPMGRLAEAEECVGAYLYLASDALSGYVTGQVMEVNGGQLMP